MVETPPSAVRRAVADTLPLLLGYAPFGLVLGAAIAASDVPDAAGVGSSVLVFAGASQLAMVELLDVGAGTVVVVLTALVINLRHVMYSAGMAPYLRDSPRWWQRLAPYLLVDPVYSLVVVRFPDLPDERDRRTYYALSGGLLLANWVALTAVGVAVGATLPAALPFDLAIPLVFIALLVPSVTDRPSLAAAVVGGGVTLLAETLPLQLGLMVGALAGVAAGLIVDRRPGRGARNGRSGRKTRERGRTACS